MSQVIVELDAELERLLQHLAGASGRSTEDLCREAVQEFLQGRLRPRREPEPDRYAPLRAMIGLSKEGPTDSSIYHDYRPGDPT